MDCLHARGGDGGGGGGGDIGFFIINCQSFAKIKNSLSLHRGQKPTVAI